MQTISPNTETKAAKDHRCDFCAGRIPKGDTYIKSTHAYDGSVYDFKTHTHCAKLADRLKMYEGCDDEGLTGDSFQETVYEEYMELMYNAVPKGLHSEFKAVLEQLKHVRFHNMLQFVILHYAQVDREKEQGNVLVKEKTIVQQNLMTRKGYSPYCGNGLTERGKSKCYNQRTVWNGDQFACQDCGWVSKLPADFIARYKEKWGK